MTKVIFSKFISQILRKLRFILPSKIFIQNTNITKIFYIFDIEPKINEKAINLLIEKFI